MRSRQNDSFEDCTPSSLLVLCAENNNEGWTRLWNLYSPVVFYWCKRREVPQSDRADVVQNILFSATKSFHLFSKNRTTFRFRNWLRCIAERRISDFFQQQKKNPLPLEDSFMEKLLADQEYRNHHYRCNSECSSDSGDFADAEENGVFSKSFINCVEMMLNPQDWELFRLSQIMKHTSTEIGSALGMTSAAVRQRKCRILKLIHEHFDYLI